MPERDRHDGAFDAGFHWGGLSRDALGRLGREFMLFAHLHDRGLMPLVAARFGPESMTDLACDEWMGASPVYNERNRRQMAIPGDGVSAIFKSLQLDVGFPHEYMDVRYELVDESEGFFQLPFCGAYQDVLRHSRGSEKAILQLCHDMEDTTFDATVMAVNPRARCRPVHRPPLPPDHKGPSCRWRVFLGDEAGTVEEHPLADRVRTSRAGRFAFDPPEEEDGGDGLRDYAGPLVPDLTLESLAGPTLVRQCREFALDAHLLMRAAFLSLRARAGDEVARELAREHRAAVAPVVLPRVRAAAGIEGDDAAAILKTLQADPALPPEYVRTGGRVEGERRAWLWVEPCEALAEGEPLAWTALLAEEEDGGLGAAVAAVNPRARVQRIPEERAPADGPVALAFEIAIDPGAEPRPESPFANAVRASNASSFRFRRR